MPPRLEPQHALGRAIRQAREQAGKTQEELAYAADIHPTWISRIESGARNPAWGTAARIADALGLKLSELAKRAESLEK